VPVGYEGEAEEVGIEADKLVTEVKTPRKLRIARKA
jgi:hypothetical protein